MQNTLTSVSIVIPVYRSAPILPVLVEKISHIARSLEHAYQFELILVNDASPDNSWQVIASLTKQYPLLTGISLMKNAGQHNAIMAGLRYAQGDIIVTMDDDLQHPPEMIAQLLEAIQAGHDVCYTKYLDRKHVAWKQLGSWFNDKIATILLKKPAGIYLSSFRALHKRVRDEIIKYEGPFPYIDGLILEVTRNIATVPIKHQARYEGEGNYTLKRSISLWLKMATNFSILPLRIATLMGGIIAFLSMLMIIIIVVQKLLDPTISAGWTSLVTIILFMGGVQLCALGIIGEYIGRTYLNVNKKPQYAVRTILQNGQHQTKLEVNDDA